MVVLKKIKASSLVETLVATVIIIVVFMIASLIFNNLMKQQYNKPSKALTAHLTELEYNYGNGLLEIPYQGEFENWRITISEQNNQLVLLAKRKGSEKKIERLLHE